MAKFNIEVSLDWMEEDGTIDDILKDEIVTQVTERIAAQTNKKLEEKILNLIDEQASEAETLINKRLSVMMEDFLTRKRTITDKWGDTVEINTSVIDILKNACDNFIDGYVDKSGNSVAKGSYCSSAYKRRIDYIIEKQIDHSMKRSIDKAAEEVKSGLQNYIDSTLKAQIGENVAKLIGLDSIVKKI